MSLDTVLYKNSKYDSRSKVHGGYARLFNTFESTAQLLLEAWTEVDRLSVQGIGTSLLGVIHIASDGVYWMNCVIVAIYRDSAMNSPQEL